MIPAGNEARPNTDYAHINSLQVLPDGVTLTIVGLAQDANFSVSPTLFAEPNPNAATSSCSATPQMTMTWSSA